MTTTHPPKVEGCISRHDRFLDWLRACKEHAARRGFQNRDAYVRMPSVRVAAVGVCLLAGLVAGCGGSRSASYSIPVETIPPPSGKVLYRVPSSSMEPTLHCARPAPGCEAAQDDRVVVQTPAGKIARGDVLAFRTPPLATVRCGAGGIFLKRVIGLGGEKVSESNGVISINSKPLDEPYIQPGRRDHEPPRSWHVPIGSYFMVGDNRAESCGSRVWGSVPAANIIGKVVQIIRVSG